MSKLINFQVQNGFYEYVLDSFINPIVKYLPPDSYTKIKEYQEGSINISFFTEHVPHRGILMSHGIADKAWRDGGRVKDYDYIFVSGEMWKQKMLNEGVQECKILVNGYTKLDPLFEDGKPIKIKNNSNRIRVLYAPTHNVNNYMSSYPKLEQCFVNNPVPDDIEIIKSYHPANKSNRATTFDLYKEVDCVISDASSTLYEALALDIPVIFPDWIVKNHILSYYSKTFEIMIYRDGIGYHANHMKDLYRMIRLAKEKGLDNTTKQFIEGIFPSSLRGSSGKTTAEFLIKIAGGEI